MRDREKSQNRLFEIMVVVAALALPVALLAPAVGLGMPDHSEPHRSPRLRNVSDRVRDGQSLPAQRGELTRRARTTHDRNS